MCLKLENLEKCFKSAKENSKRYVGVKIGMKDFPCDEVIINEYPNFDKKLDYYKNAYNEDLTLKAFNGIKISAFTFGDSYEDIEKDLLGGKK